MASTADGAGLREDDVDPDPIVQFQRWFADAQATGDPLPEAMNLATTNGTGIPSARMVLLKGVDARGFVFFTNHESQKGKDLAENPRAALVFYWGKLGRQVRVSGTVSRVSSEESDAYFRNRPLESRLSAAASPQTAVIPSRDVLETRVQELRRQYDGDVPRPSFWGGYRVSPDSIEFWLHRENRLHDRLRYTRQPDRRWRLERLAP
ncbi:MAG TPA: pyridoxamine 5'-phosphate oxidase [Candidatus Eisenbacteria bacterium]|nr:pyridoxamine 5'-phosphate oxidase [Candidatus Eisenbacteria bacterium]